MNEEQSRMIGELYAELYEQLLSYAYAQLASGSLAEEAIQETFQIACQKPDSVCGSPNPQGWITNTLFYTVSNMKKSRATAKRIIETRMMPQLRDSAFAEDRLPLKILYGNIAKTYDFKLLHEMAVEGKSHEEMAKSRGISVNACKKRVQRAKEKLKKRLKL